MATGRHITVQITHTINVDLSNTSKSRLFSERSVVTKYVICVEVENRGSDGQTPPGAEKLQWQVARRYSHFRSNHRALQAMFSRFRLPKLPPRKMQTTTAPDPEVCCASPIRRARMHYFREPAHFGCPIRPLPWHPPHPIPHRPQLVSTRMVELNRYLRLLLATPAICSCTQLLTFLGAYHAQQPFAFAAPPPSATELARAARSPTRLTGAWDSSALHALRLGERAGDLEATALDVDIKRQARWARDGREMGVRWA